MDSPLAHEPLADRYDVVIIGGGVIGLSVAWRTAALGMRVAVVDPEPGRGASWAAAGMLAPVTEVHYGEERLLELNLASCRRWPSFAEEVESASDCSVGYRRCGTLLVAADEGDRASVEELFSFQRELGLEVEWLSARRARQLEPGLSPRIRAGMLAANDHQVDNRLLVPALLAAARSYGCTFHFSRAVALESAGNVLQGVRLDDGSVLRASSSVLAAGAWSNRLEGLPQELLPPVRPVKGQIMRLTSPGGPELLGRSVRALVNGAPVYLVPRSNGTVVIGGTVEEQGFDTAVTAGAVYEMLRDAHRVVPGVSELHLDESMAGLRPGSPDNAPMVGEVSSAQMSGLVVATGHYRNGVLLAPLTAEAVAMVLNGAESPAEFLPFSPGRFHEAGALSWGR